MSSANKILIAGEDACAMNELPEIWQQIAKGEGGVGVTEPQIYVQMAQLLLYKFRTGDLDLFTKRSDFAQHKEAFCGVLGALARETLEFYGVDFRKENYPDFTAIGGALLGRQASEDELRVLKATEVVFGTFKYDFPASFYWCQLAPLDRESVTDIIPLRFSEKDKKNARAWDASLHAQKVFPIQLTVQSILSQHGFFALHGCGCNHGLQRLGRTESSFSYSMAPEMTRTWIRDFVWTTWYEYAYFPITPVTRLMTGELVEFEE